LGTIELAKQDGILISVLLLSLFEVSFHFFAGSSRTVFGICIDLFKTSASDRPCSMISWLQHIRGAISLLKLRGNKQLETHIGRRLFVQLRTSIVRKPHFCPLTILRENR